MGCITDDFYDRQRDARGGAEESEVYKTQRGPVHGRLVSGLWHSPGADVAGAQPRQDDGDLRASDEQARHPRARSTDRLHLCGV